MTNKFAGYTLGLGAIAMMMGLMAVDVKSLKTWAEIFTPVFVGTMMAHLSAVIMAFLGGKLIPTKPQNQREDDPKPSKIKIANPWEGGE